MTETTQHTKLFEQVHTRRIYLWGIPIDPLSMEETVALIDAAIQARYQITHAAVNVAKFVAMQENPELRRAVCESTIVNADGYPLVWLARLMGYSVPERVTGIDLMEELVKLAARRQYRIFFFGAEEWVVRKVVDIYASRFSPEIIAGWHNGYYVPQEEPVIAQQIASTHPDMLFVAMSSPKKELFLWKYRNVLGSIPFVMGVGGSFDVVAGKVKRAPRWMQRSGLEWFYRLLQEPRRMWKRYAYTNTKFLLFLARALWQQPKGGKNRHRRS